MDRLKKAFSDLRRKAQATSATRWSRKELGQIALFKGAHQQTIAPLLDNCSVRVLARSEALVRAGEPCTALYLVLSGRLRMEDTAAKSSALVRAGDSIGELFLLGNATVAATITATEPTRLLVLDRDVAWTLIRTSHEIARNWLALLAERTRVNGIIAGSEELKTTHARNATHDERTGLHNRHWLDEMLPRQIARSSAANAALGLLLVEIDNFADYARQYGQAAGDQAHYATAKTIVDSVRPTDLVVCYGTAQFAVMLPDSTAASACLVGERMRHAIGRLKNFSPEAGGLPMFTISVGAAQYQAPADASAFLTAAEAALTLVKQRGGDRVGMQER